MVYFEYFCVFYLLMTDSALRLDKSLEDTTGSGSVFAADAAFALLPVVDDDGARGVVCTSREVCAIDESGALLQLLRAPK
mmetsp:Transcript_13602/g.23635  ORF Transcript_13602/g.23635 Transcript_13602/m.23635 type:complete len:80 (+) Transcript_13602:32-271(+)